VQALFKNNILDIPTLKSNPSKGELKQVTINQQQATSNQQPAPSNL
jgi:hypothetical protein